jgi:hypothetical protein
LFIVLERHSAESDPAISLFIFSNCSIGLSIVMGGASGGSPLEADSFEQHQISMRTIALCFFQKSFNVG